MASEEKERGGKREEEQRKDVHLAMPQVLDVLPRRNPHGVVERREVKSREEGVGETEGEHERDPAYNVREGREGTGGQYGQLG